MAQASTHPQITPLDTSIVTDHRKLLNPDHHDEPVSSQDEFSDDGRQAITSPHDGSAEADMIGVSISRAQSYMKSPETPAIEKVRALESSAGYFAEALDNPDRISEGSEGEHTPPDNDTNAPDVAAPHVDTHTTDQEAEVPSPWQAHPPLRSSLVKAALGDTSVDQRQRASSSSSLTLGNLRRLLPDLPSMPSIKLPNSPFRTGSTDSKSGRKEGRSRAQSTASQTVSRGRSPPAPDPAARAAVAIPSPTGLDGNVESLLSPTSPGSAKSRGRANSEGSLYMRRKVTGLSNYDDISAFADVSDMANSRFKAITDSLQNSTLRFPKMPHVKANKKFTNHDRNSTDVLTDQNTARNARSSSRTNQYQYTNMHNIRRGRKVDMETPQQRAHPILSEALSRTTGDIVVLGGYRGSILRDAKTRRQLWAPVKVGLNLRNVDLEVGLEREDEERAEEKVIPSGVLSHIGPIDICRRLLKHFYKCPNTKDGLLRVHDWGYDWRLSPDLLSARLIEFLEGLKCNQPDTPVEQRGAIVVAHSLGGLITRHAVNQRPELFSGVLYAGTPQNCVNILGPLRNGDDVLLSSRVLTAQVNFTLRTSYVLLPENGRCFIQKQTNERYDLDFFDPSIWDEYRLSPCINPCLHPQAREHRKSLIGSISDSISSSLPSVPGKRGSWFGGQPSNSNSISTSPERINSRDSKPPTAPSENQDVPDNYESRPSRGLAEASLEPTMTVHPHHPSSYHPSISPRPSIATTCTIPLPQAKSYLARILAEVLDFKQQLPHQPDLQSSNRYPPHALMFGDTVPTVYGAKVSSREAIKYSDAFDDLAFAAGDGVVLASAAQLPEGYRCVKGGRVKSERGHVGLLGDLEGVGRALGALIEGRRKGIGLGVEYRHHLRHRRQEQRREA